MAVWEMIAAVGVGAEGPSRSRRDGVAGRCGDVTFGAQRHGPHVIARPSRMQGQIHHQLECPRASEGALCTGHLDGSEYKDRHAGRAEYLQLAAR